MIIKTINIKINYFMCFCFILWLRCILIDRYIYDEVRMLIDMIVLEEYDLNYFNDS